MKIRNTPTQERPRERCLEQGPAGLSTRECIAILLGSGPREVGCMGLAERLLEKPGRGMAHEEETRALFTALEVSGAAHLSGIRGLGPAGRARLLVAFELGRRYAALREQTHQQKKYPSRGNLARKVLAKVPKSKRESTREWLAFVPVYRDRSVGEFCVVEQGVRTHVNTDPVELFARILPLRPSGFFLVHNHPSGLASPSEEDELLTREVARLARNFSLDLLGHWVVCAGSETLISSP